nr:hypothetical protein [Nonomuraea turkmeniaca]
MSPYTTGRIVASDRATLARSRRPASGSRYSGSSVRPATSTSTMNGTPSRNAEPHQKCSSSSPPTSGPTVMPSMKQLYQSPIAVPICFPSVNMFLISASDDGSSVAPAMPSSARVTISISALTAYPASTDAPPKAAAPIIRSLRRPILSPSVPMVTRKPARKNEYTSMIHSCCEAVAPRSPLRCGSARYRTLTSMESRRATEARTARPVHSRRPASVEVFIGFPFPLPPRSGTGLPMFFSWT